MPVKELQKKVRLDSHSNYVCAECGASQKSFNHVYCVPVTLSDSCGSIETIAYDSFMDKLLGYGANDFYRLINGSQELAESFINTRIQKPLNVEVIFKASSSRYDGCFKLISIK
jgi:Replication factor-A C terminal domain